MTKYKVETILIYRQNSLPYQGIASRTEIYRRYIESNDHQIDYIICPRPEREFNGVNYSFYKKGTSFGIFKNFYEELNIYKSLKRIIEKDKKYVIKIIDDSGLVVLLNKILSRKFIRENFYIIYCVHGYQLNFTGRKMIAFNELIDIVVYLTEKSYRHNKIIHNVLTPRAKVIHNGIDNNIFKPIDIGKKKLIKNKLGLKHNEKIFLWCSQDRSKKGIDLTLNFWKKVIRQHPNANLLIVGIDRKIEMKGVIHIGKVPNLELPKYYQVSNVYLFTSLCYEGFPLSLTEALKCGCYCIASDYGGVSEVLGNGEYGKLIKKPHFIEEWIDAIDEYFESPKKFKELPHDKYSSEQWNLEMNKLILEIKAEF